MNQFLIAFAAIAFISTFIGGLLVFKYKHMMPYVFSFAAGTLIAVTFLEILPESLELAEKANIPIRSILITIVLSFFLYNLIERFFVTHPVHEHDGHGHIMGPIGAGSLVIHSFFDGAAIGAAFQVNTELGLVVAMAVVFHDFTDGVNTVTLMLKNKHTSHHAFIFLIMAAMAPVIGLVLTTYLNLPIKILAFLLAFFAGEFIYIGAAMLVPETKQTTKSTIIAMALGILAIIALTSIVTV